MSGQGNWSPKQLLEALQGLLSARAGMVLTLVVMAALILAETASAEVDVGAKKNVKRQKIEQTITTTTTEDDGTADAEAPAPLPMPVEEGVLTSKFGSKATSGTSGCKTEAASEDLIRKLKIECKNWINEQKQDLKKKYQASTCEESCEDCGMSLQRCTVTGTVRYAK